MSKYRNRRTACQQGHMHDSMREAIRCNELTLLQRGGEISHLEQQPKFKLEVEGRPVLIKSARYPKGRQATYSADFSYRTTNGLVVEDSKGFKTDIYKLKKAMVEAMYPGLEVRET